MEEFKKELADLLRKHGAYIIAKSNLNDDDLSLEIGFQQGMKNTWSGRFHLGSFDLDGNQESKS